MYHIDYFLLLYCILQITFTENMIILLLPSGIEWGDRGGRDQNTLTQFIVLILPV